MQIIEGRETNIQDIVNTIEKYLSIYGSNEKSVFMLYEAISNIDNPLWSIVIEKVEYTMNNIKEETNFKKGDKVSTPKGDGVFQRIDGTSPPMAIVKVGDKEMVFRVRLVKMKESVNIIEIKEDFNIPNTDIVLEAGDKIEIITEKSTVVKSGAVKLNVEIPWEILDDGKERSTTRYTLMVNGQKNYSDFDVAAIIKNWTSITNRMKIDAKKVFGAWIKKQK